MDTSIELLEKTLRKNSVFVTNARRIVFSALWNSEPQTMQELEVRINSKINRTSIYRVIELFIELGIVHKIQIGWKYKIELSDIFVEHHHHISCVQCGKLVSVHEHDEIERFINNVTKKYGFTSTTHQLEIQGTCSECKG